MTSVTKNTMHLSAKVSTCPTLKKGLLRLYSMYYCPYAQRARIVLDAKKIKYETVNINLKNKPEWFLEFNPLGKVPILQCNNKIMYESMVICDYVDEVYPDPPLYSEDFWAKAVDKSLIQVFEDKVIKMFYKCIFPGKEEVQHFRELTQKGLDLFESELKNRGKKYFAGDKPGMLDYAMAPYFERLLLMPKLEPGQILLPINRYPLLNEYTTLLFQDDAVASNIAPEDDMLAFQKSFFNRNPNYDIGI